MAKFMQADGKECDHLPAVPGHYNFNVIDPLENNREKILRIIIADKFIDFEILPKRMLSSFLIKNWHRVA